MNDGRLRRFGLSMVVVGAVFGLRGKYPALGFSKPFNRVPELWGGADIGSGRAADESANPKQLGAAMRTERQNFGSPGGSDVDGGWRGWGGR